MTRQQMPALTPNSNPLSRFNRRSKLGLGLRGLFCSWRELSQMFVQVCTVAIVLCGAVSAASAAGIDEIIRANQLFTDGRYAEAEAAHTRILNSGVKELFVSEVLADSIQLYRGLARLVLGNLDGAAQDAEAAIVHRRSSLTMEESGYGLRALVRLQKGDTQGAFADYDKAIEYAAKGIGSGYRSAEAYAQRAYGFMLIGDPAKAKQDLAKASEFDGKFMFDDFLKYQLPFWSALTGDFLTAVQNGDAERARGAQERVLAGLRQDPGWKTGNGALSHAAQFVMFDVRGPLEVLLKRLEARGEAKQATQNLALLAEAQTAMIRNDRNAAFEIYLRIYREAKDKETRNQALSGMATVLPGLPKKPQVSEATRKLLVQAQVLIEDKDYQGAIRRYTEAEMQAPWFAQLHYDRAMLLGSQNRFGEAIEEMQAYLALASDAKDARASQDQIYQWQFKMERSKDANTAAANTSTLTPGARGASATAAGNPNCFIATAAYGSYLDPHVVQLRAFRDAYLLPYSAGRWFVAAYYKYSPPVANAVGEHAALRTAVRVLLTPIVVAISLPVEVLCAFILAAVVWLAGLRLARAPR